MKARNKKTGEIVEFTCIDNYMGKYRFAKKAKPFGIIKSEDMIIEDEFNELYDPVEDPNHPYGGLEDDFVIGIPHCEFKSETLEDRYFKGIITDFKLDIPDVMCNRFYKEFVDEDTGLLNIGKYDHERLLTWINKEIKKQ